MIDIVSPQWLMESAMQKDAVILNNISYRTLLLPYFRYLKNDLLEKAFKIIESGVNVFVDVEDVSLIPDFGKYHKRDNLHEFSLVSGAIETIRKSVMPTFDVPNGAIGNVRRSGNSYTACLIPDRSDGTYKGTFREARGSG